MLHRPEILKPPTVRSTYEGWCSPGSFRVHCKCHVFKSSRFADPLPLPRDRAVPARRLRYTKHTSVGVTVKTRGPCDLPFGFARERVSKLVTLLLRRRSGRGVQTG